MISSPILMVSPILRVKINMGFSDLVRIIHIYSYVDRQSKTAEVQENTGFVMGE